MRDVETGSVWRHRVTGVEFEVVAMVDVCVRDLDVPRCVLLELGFVADDERRAMALYEEGTHEELFGEPAPGRCRRPHLFSRVGGVKIFTHRVQLRQELPHVTGAVYVYQTKARASDEYRCVLAEEECWTQADARLQHRRMLLKVARGEVGHG